MGVVTEDRSCRYVAAEPGQVEARTRRPLASSTRTCTTLRSGRASRSGDVTGRGSITGPEFLMASRARALQPVSRGHAGPRIEHRPVDRSVLRLDLADDVVLGQVVSMRTAGAVCHAYPSWLFW